MNFQKLDYPEAKLIQCRECGHFCGTYNEGLTFGVNSEAPSGGVSWLKAGEYAPCGKRLSLDSHGVVEINYNDILDQWGEEILKIADEKEDASGYEEVGSYRHGLLKGISEGIRLTSAKLALLERKHLKSV